MSALMDTSAAETVQLRHVGRLVIETDSNIILPSRGSMLMWLERRNGGWGVLRNLIDLFLSGT